MPEKNIKEKLLEEFKILAIQLQLREETVGGYDERAIIRNFISKVIDEVREEEKERLSNLIAEYQVDLCENSQEFKSFILKELN